MNGINSRKIKDLQPKAQLAITLLIAELAKLGCKVIITQTLRDATYQNWLYQSGRKRPGPKLTNCDGYKSKSAHQSGLAVDLCPVDDKGACIWNDESKWKLIADTAVKMGWRSGYYFRSLKDSPHVELIEE